jgi:hypothetical protein
VELSLLDRAQRYRRLALLFADESPSATIRVNKQLGAARRQGEEAVNHVAKSQAAD